MLISLVLALSMTTCYGSVRKNIIIRLGHINAPGTTADRGANKFKELVEAKSKGRVKVQLFPNSQLGGENDMVDHIQMGSLEMEITGDGPINVFMPQYGALTMPYLFRDANHMLKVFRGPIGKKFSNDLAKAKGSIVIDYWLRGPRILVANKAIKTPNDLRGVKIRLPEMKVYIEVWNTLGANATTMAWSELYMALQQKVVDAAESPYDLIYGSSLYEVLKYVMRTQHVYGPYLVLIGEKFYKGLPNDVKKIVKNSIKEAGVFANKATLTSQDDLEKALKGKGMIIVNVDKKAFRDKLKGLPEKLEKQLNWKPGLYKRAAKVK
jgi:tripartite ATP-independent transporter DctP family solute receptor